MNVIINDAWFYAIEINNNDEFAVEIPEGHLHLFNEIFDNAHKTHGMAKFLNIAYAMLLQENNAKGKTSSKCKVGHYKMCELHVIVPNYHKDNAYAFFKYQSKE